MLEHVGVTSVEIHLDEVKNWSVNEEMSFPSETIHTHAFRLQAHRKSTAGRALVPLTLLKATTGQKSRRSMHGAQRRTHSSATRAAS
jgi:hypothetical protein